MHLFVLGGNGRTGSIIIDEAVSHGHTVTALVRNLAKVRERANVTFIKGTPTSATDVANAFDAAPWIDTVLVALNAPRESDNPFSKSISPPRLMADSVKNTTTMMMKYGVKKIVIMQAFGVGSSFTNLNFLMRMIISHSPMSQQFADHNAVDRDIREASTDGSFSWTLVRPAMLKGDGFLPVKVLGNDGEGGSFMPQCSRKSVARFIIEKCVETGEFDNHTPVICN